MPRVWLLLGDKVGDNAQVQAIAERLPWPAEVRSLTFKKRFRKGKPPFLVSLYHLDRRNSARLEPPWPDLLLTVGRRPAMVALWIRRQSGQRTRVVLIGRPKRLEREFALIVVPSQYDVPDAANVLRIGLPLMRPDAARVAEAGVQWAERFASLPRPLVGVFVGAATKPFALGPELAPQLLAAARTYTGQGGTLYVSTSRRTPAAVTTALGRQLGPDDRLFDFATGGDNPYQALLASADVLMVTGDSVSMLTEVAALGKPLVVFPLPRASSWLERPLVRWMLGALGLVGHRRDLTVFHQWLYDHGFAVAAGEPLPHGTPAATALRGNIQAANAKVPAPLPSEVDRVVGRIKELMNGEDSR